MDNPGKYDRLCTYVREQANAHTAIVIIIGGDKGNGFSVQAPKEVIESLPKLLSSVAADITHDLQDSTCG